MNPSDLKAFEGIYPFLSSPDFLEAQRLASNPDFLALYNAGIKASKGLSVQSVDIPPEALIAESAAISALRGINIAHINSLLGQFDQIPSENFGVIKQAVSQNRSKIRDAAKANHEVASDIVQKASESDTDESLVFSEAVAGLLTDVDDSIELPDSDADKKVHISKSHPSFSNILTLIGILLSIYAIYQNQSSSELIKQNHSEQMQEEHKQTQLNKQAINLEEQQTEYLEQIAENTASANSTDQASEEPSKNKTQ